ncbi:transmembrane protein 45A isoform X2 [Ictalurus punctatus]|uniref:Transmembrane protein 45A isoform X2 n=1 Tax=Ictalurus punctatus TaxID=7998 RepID=A0A2D0RXC4_ICTPU|nr:transmembrane protein 45A isoform X2 [Ictalurus punctatus]
MGSFKGHALPGSMLLISGVWWAVKYSLWYAIRRNKSAGAARLTTRATQHRLEIVEGAMMLFFAIVGMLGEQFTVDGPKLHLYDSSTQHWEKLMNWQHTTIYLFFGLAGATSLTVHSTSAAPLALDRLLLGLAFFNEGFIFLYHLHGREMLDVHVHMLLLYAVFGGALVCLLEVFHRGNVLLELLRAALSLLQGSWFWQIAFVLYPPSEVKWDQSDHNNAMFITMCYSWHLAFALAIVAVAHTTVICIVRSKLSRIPPMEMGLLKPQEREGDSEDEGL